MPISPLAQARDHEEDTMPKYPNVKVQLSGEDGNTFMIVGRVSRAMKAAAVSLQEREAMSREVLAAESYDDALQAVMRWVDWS